MSQPAFEMINSILDIWKIAIQAIMFLVLWAAAFRGKKGKMDGIVAVLFIFANIGIGFLSCAAWVRYGVSAFVIMGYAGICYKKQIRKAVFVMLAFYNLHCLSFLIANSIYIISAGRRLSVERIRCPNPKCGRHILDIEQMPPGETVLEIKCRRCGEVVGVGFGSQ